MEAGDPAARQSGPPLGPSSDSRSRPTSVHHHAPYHHPQPPLERPIRDHNGHSMAAASVLPPSSHYSTTQSSSYSTANPSPAHNMMSSDPHKGGPLDKDPAASRQSLPSISDVLKVTEPRQYPSPAPSVMPSSSTFPSPYPQANGRNPYDDKHTSPQGLQHPAFPPRQEPPPPAGYAESSRSSFSSSRPPLPPVADRRPSPPMRPDIPPHHPAQEPPRHHEHPHHPHTGGYAPHEHAQQPHPPPPPPPQSYSHAPMPPGQYPLPGHPVSPRHNGPPGPHPPHGYDQRAPHGYPERPGYASSERLRHEPPSHYDNTTYADALQRVSAGGRTIFNVGEHYYGILSEQGVSTLPPLSRLPSDIEIADMLGNIEMMKRSWEQIREIVQDAARNERSLDASRPPKHAYDDDEMMYRDGDMKAPGYAEPKKQRRGRAAPPGRCHSCNRIDTPEWRRGPDGARTLCNACGLHYAKLERKRQLEQKQQAQQQAHRPRHE